MRVNLTMVTNLGYYYDVYFSTISPVHGHDEPGRAEPALRAVVADEAGLHLVEAVGSAHALNGCDRPSVALQQGRYALQKTLNPREFHPLVGRDFVCLLLGLASCSSQATCCPRNSCFF